MSRAKDLVDLINAAKINTPHMVDEVIDIDGVNEIATIDYDEHRWYTNATVVFQVVGDDEYFGVFGPVSLKSEMSEYADIDAECEAFEMEAVPSVTYRRKKPTEV